jgi:flavin reductase (DIM6/NTAB) family NADH-FMN oxidoreductase RutF
MKKSAGAKTLPVPAAVPVWVVGTYDPAGRANVMTAAWAGICCSKPPCIAVSLRKATYSYGNIVARKAFTVSIPSAASAKTADFLGLASGRDLDKFAKGGLTAVRSELVDAPYVQEFPIVIECRLLHTIELGLHTQFIGEIQDVKIEESLLGPEASIDTGKLPFFIFQGGYWSATKYLGQAFSIGKEVMR